jgi:hypothetical protein
MIQFFANLLPFIALIWSLSLFLFNVSLYENFTEERGIKKFSVPLAMIGLCTFFILFPVRSVINFCNKNQGISFGDVKYTDYYDKFPTDYERENPVTRSHGLQKWIRFKKDKETNPEVKNIL